MTECSSVIIPDFSNIDASTKEEEIKRRFYESAKDIMLCYDLIHGTNCSQITALELYLFHPQLWPDNSTDCDKQGVQLELGRWYIRRVGWSTQWRIDITAGVKTQSIYAGLLIAAVGNEDGSGNALNAILYGNERHPNGKRKWGYADKGEILRSIHNSDIFSESSYLRLKRRVTPRLGTFLVGKRKNPPRSKPHFVEAALRIAVDPPCGKWKSSNELQMTPWTS